MPTWRTRIAREFSCVAATEQYNEGFVTVSVDDGHSTDLRTADLLNKYGIPATFYIPGRNPERPVISTGEMRRLADSFELGAHTMSHVPLNKLPLERAWHEIADGKAWLEDTIGKPVESFCYPRGKHTGKIAALVRRAGFRGARTCCLNRHDFPADPYMWAVSTQGHNHGRAVQIRHALFERNLWGAFNYLKIYKGTVDWAAHFGQALDWVSVNGGIAHLYFHSWEIEQANEWRKLESVMRAIGERAGLRRVTNGELFVSWGARRHAHRST